jgi:hypothetical protein
MMLFGLISTLFLSKLQETLAVTPDEIVDNKAQPFDWISAEEWFVTPHID